MSTNLPFNEQPKASRVPCNGSMLIGPIVIAVGGFFLLKNLGIVSWDFDLNWWALLMLIPAGGILLNVWQEYQRNDGNLTRELRNKLVAGAGILLLALFFLTGLEWDRYWPLFLILGGVALLVNVLGSPERGV